MATSALVTGGRLQSAATTALVSGGTLSSVVTTQALVTGGTLASSAVSTKAYVTGGYLRSGQAEPFSTVALPVGTWTQTAGPTAAPPNVLAPGAPSPGTTVSYSQANGTVATINVLPHSTFRRDPTTGNLTPIRRTPA